MPLGISHLVWWSGVQTLELESLDVSTGLALTGKLLTPLSKISFICVLRLKTVATSWDYTNDEGEIFKNHAQPAVKYILCVSFIV